MLNGSGEVMVAVMVLLSVEANSSVGSLGEPPVANPVYGPNVAAAKGPVVAGGALTDTGPKVTVPPEPSSQTRLSRIKKESALGIPADPPRVPLIV